MENDAPAAAAAVPLEQWYFDIPPVTRTYATLALLITLACQFHLVSPFQLFFLYEEIVYRKQYWRLVTNFLFFGTFGLDFLFYLFFMYSYPRIWTTRYCRYLEENSFRNRTADMVWMLILGAVVMTMVAPIVKIPFMASSLTIMMVYIWARRNPTVRMNFLGVLDFNAPYLPFVLIGFSLLFNNRLPVQDVLGVIVGHMYYFLEDVYPVTSRTGIRYLQTPAILKQLLDAPQPRHQNDADIGMIGLDQTPVIAPPPNVDGEERPHQD